MTVSENASGTVRPTVPLEEISLEVVPEILLENLGEVGCHRSNELQHAFADVD